MMNWGDVLDRIRSGNPAPPTRDERSNEQWKAVLSEEAYRVTRTQGTERAFSSQMCSLFEPGTYACVCCGTTLFDSDTKFESGTGWPSFSAPVADNVINFIQDVSHGMQRVETTCAVCDAHLGHVFPDGPAPTGLRYCMNAVALQKP